MNNRKCTTIGKVFHHRRGPDTRAGYHTYGKRTVQRMLDASLRAASPRRAVASLRLHRTKPVRSPASARFISTETALLQAR